MSDDQQEPTMVDGPSGEVDLEVVEANEGDRDDVLDDDMLEDSGDDMLEESGDELDDGAREDTDAFGDVLVLEEVDNSLVLPVWEPTGEPRVDEALDELVRLDPDDVHQHAAIYADVHERLRDVLSNLGSTA